MEKACVSIVTPILDGKKHFDLPMRTVLSQDYENFQWIIVDNGSTDGTYEMLLELARSDRRIEVYQEKERGLSQARNCGLGYVRGDYITFLDADDGLSPNALSERVLFLERNSHYGACFCTAAIVNETGDLLLPHMRSLCKFITYPQLLSNNFFPHMPLFRYANVRNLRFSTEYPHEAAYLYWYGVLLLTGGFHFVDDCYVIYTVRSSSMSKNFSDQAFDACNALEHYYFKKPVPDDSTFPKALRNCWTRNIFDFQKASILLNLVVFLVCTKRNAEASKVLREINKSILPPVFISIRSIEGYFLKKIGGAPGEWRNVWESGKNDILPFFRKELGNDVLGLEPYILEFINKQCRVPEMKELKDIEKRCFSLIWKVLMLRYEKIALFGCGKFLSILSMAINLETPFIKAIYDDFPPFSEFNGIPVLHARELTKLDKGIPVVLCTDTWQDEMRHSIEKSCPGIEIIDVNDF